LPGRLSGIGFASAHDPNESRILKQQKTRPRFEAGHHFNQQC